MFAMGERPGFCVQHTNEPNNNNYNDIMVVSLFIDGCSSSAGAMMQNFR